MAAVQPIGSSQGPAQYGTAQAAPGVLPAVAGALDAEGWLARPRRFLLSDVGVKVASWLSLLVCITGSMTSVLLWRILDAYRQHQVESAVQAAATDVARQIQADVNRQIGELRQLASIWSEFGATDADEWQSGAKAFMQSHEGFLAIEWNTGSPTPAGRLAAGTAEALTLLAERRPDESRGPSANKSEQVGTVDAMSSPLPLADGGTAYEISIQFQKSNENQQGLRSLFQPAAALDRLLGQTPSGCALAVKIGELEIFRHDETGGAHALVRRAPIDLELGAHWDLTAAPGPKLLAAMDQRLPIGALVAGLVISFLLASIIQLGQVSAARARALVQAKSDLEAQLQAGELAVERLRSLSQAQAAPGQERSASLDETVAELETFNYSVSHDLRSPMSAILNYSAVLGEDYKDRLDDTAREYLSRIVSSATTAVSRMDSLLALSRVGQLPVHDEEIDMRALVREVFDEVALGHAGRRPEFLLGDLPALHADRDMLRLLVTNLLSNALKFTLTVESPRIEVGGYVQGAETTYYVNDNGIGFDVRNAPKLFHVFKRFHGGGYEGHGVGLAIVERIARRHEGRVWAEGALGKGATFFFSFPNEGANHFRA